MKLVLVLYKENHSAVNANATKVYAEHAANNSYMPNMATRQPRGGKYRCMLATPQGIYQLLAYEYAWA